MRNCSNFVQVITPLELPKAEPNFNRLAFFYAKSLEKPPDSLISDSL